MAKIEKKDLYVGVSYDFLMNKMPGANATYVKIYLYILANQGNDISYKEIATRLDVLESDVVNAIEYWQNQDCLSKDGESIFISALNTRVETSSYKKENVSVCQTSEDVSDSIIANPALRDMMQMAQEVLQKQLSKTDMETLFWIYDGLGFGPEAVLMLLEYCVSKGRPHISYAEKVAVSWSEKGLVTTEDISLYMKELERTNQEIKRVTDAMGISLRPLSKGEESFFNKWQEEYHMSSDMMLLAYEYCIMQTGKLSFPYIDKILEDWNKKDIHTVSKAQNDHQSHKETSRKFNSGKDTNEDYSYSDLEKLMRGN